MTAEPTREELLELIRVLREENARLKKRIEELERQQRKYVAPHSRGQRKADPKKAGRKAGEGTFAFRDRPEPTEIDGPAIEVPVPNTCEACGFQGELVFLKTDLAWVTDLPEGKRFKITEYRVPVMLCPKCGKRVRGQHVDLAHDQCGATAHRLGKQLVATLLSARYELGIPERKVPRLAQMTLGLSITQGAVSQMAKRIAAPGQALQQHLSELTTQLRTSAYVHHDDTGWRIGGKPAWVSAFRSDKVALFTINEQHTRSELLETLGENFNGVLIADRFKVYDSHDLAHLPQQKCLAHILRNINEVLVERQGKVGQGQQYPERLKALFQESLHIHKNVATGELTAEEYQRTGEALHLRLDGLLNRPSLRSKSNERLRKGLLKQHQEGRLLYFLTTPGIPATNNAAERQLRSVVITRKVSQCSKTALGAMNYASIKSVVETARLQGEDPVELLARLYR